MDSQDKLIFKGYTHVFSVEGILQREDLKRYRYILMSPSVVQTSTDVIKLVPKIFDFIREVYIMNGKLLFVEDVSDQSQIYLNSVFLREAILYSLASLFKCSVYDMWMLINNQVVWKITADALLQYPDRLDPEAEFSDLPLPEDFEFVPAIPQLPVFLWLQHTGRDE